MNKFLYTALLAMSFLAAPSLGSAGSSLSAEVLKRDCLSEDSTQADRATCYSYILSTRAALEFGALIATYQYEKDNLADPEIMLAANLNLHICIGDEVSIDEIVNAVLAYLKLTDDLAGVSATQAIFQSLKMIYSC